MEAAKSNRKEQDSLLNEFFDNFGTHAIMSVEMGDKFVTKATISTEKYLENK